MNEETTATIDWAAAYMLFAFILLTFFGWLLLALLFAGLALRGAWRWLKEHTWPHAIVSAERKVLRGRP